MMESEFLLFGDPGLLIIISHLRPALMNLIKTGQEQYLGLIYHLCHVTLNI